VSPTSITYMRDEDLLDEPISLRRPETLGLSRRRQLLGLGIAAVALPLLTLLLQQTNGFLTLDGQVLIYLLAVVGIALAGGVLVGVASAIAAALLINFYFVDPLHTLNVSDPDQVLSLFVFVAVAAIVSIAVEVATRRYRLAERARQESETLSALSEADLSEEGTLHDVLGEARRTFGMESVALMTRTRGTSQWHEAEHAGWAPPGDEAPLRFDVPVGTDVRLVGRGPALFAKDERVLRAFAAAANSAWQGQRLSGKAEQAEALATVDKQRTAILAAVGHDLRTPLAGIKAAVSGLRQQGVDWSEEERRELEDTIEDSVDRLDAVIANLLDASRLQAGALAVHLEPVALDEVISAALISLGAASADVAVDAPEDLPPVSADRGLLERVLVNLIDNGIVHGGGSVAVSAFAGAKSAKLEIVDHGAGVPADEQDRLFEAFQRLDDRRPTGVGLGLTVARGFVEAMGGEMGIDTTPGGGMTMRVRLNLATAKVPAAATGDE
jgi:two-component system, OmpR family, sensor histidine kinase KdpD